jgi:hypothetical protein
VGKLVKFGLHAGNMNFNTQNEEWISICITLRVYFFYVSCALKVYVTDKIREEVLKMQFTK